MQIIQDRGMKLLEELRERGLIASASTVDEMLIVDRHVWSPESNGGQPPCPGQVYRGFHRIRVPSFLSLHIKRAGSAEGFAPRRDSSSGATCVLDENLRDQSIA